MESAVSAPLVPTTHSLLRPDQVEEMEGERESLQQKMRNPAIQEKGAVADQLRRLERQLDTQRAKPFPAAEIDRAVKREAELREEIKQGMLSHEEMRKSPPGAVDAHRAWEKRNKPGITEWQNIQRRLNHDNDAREVASIETFRPTHSTMNMDGALIPGRQYFMPPPGVGPTVTFTDEEITELRDAMPDVAAQLPLLTNERRAEVKAMLRVSKKEAA